MTGRRRLAVFLSVSWIAFLWLVALGDAEFNLSFVAWGALAPIGLAWGIWWVRQGFKRGNA